MTLSLKAPIETGRDVTSQSTQLRYLGDLPRLSEPTHARRARFHQAWYRAERLGILGWGRTPQGRPLGSILPPHAAQTGHNFTSDEAQNLFATRRTQGWGVDPVRMTSHMTSSQALLVNLLGPLGVREPWLLDTLATVLNRQDFRSLLRWEVEFAPHKRSLYLNDQTRVDAYFEIDTFSGVEAVVLELKYTDRFSSRRLAIAANPNYSDLRSSASIWTAPLEEFQHDVSSQLLRCHALGARILQVDRGSLRTTLLLVSHPSDRKAADVFGRYRTHLVDAGTASHIHLNAFLDTAKSVAASPSERAKVDGLYLRYLHHEASEPLWQEHLKTT